MTSSSMSGLTIDQLLQKQVFNTLTPDQVTSFMKYGFLRLPGAIKLEDCDRWAKDVWHRLGMDPNDKSTWTSERIHMAKLHNTPAKEIAPAAWAAICELCGGEERIAKGGEMWTDGFIVNLGSEETDGNDVPPKDLKGWHVDGDFFTHFLDSPEQALLVIPCWSDVKPSAGATWICDQGPKIVGQHLEAYSEDNYFNRVVQSAPNESFHEMTGNKGDVILMHPLMLHSASVNARREIRIITNPPVSLSSPFQFARSNPAEYSLIELKTMQELGGPSKLKDWKITGKREMFVPRRFSEQQKKQELELDRLRRLGLDTGEVLSQAPNLLVSQQ
ncbi:hypothetical protein HJFPF1_13173 [Paramyrothecium foliicola]|nr:hypothetical protein HJFPF1_13173 [Paramyrothecium foliicola]